MRRVVRLLEEGVPGQRILLVSFTRVAAADLREKVAALEAPDVELVRATTLHGYCFGLLRRDAVLTATRRRPRILLAHEVDLMLRDIGGDYGDIRERRRMLEAYTAGWARGTEDHPGLASNDADRDFENSVLTWLQEHGAMLIGEVVPLAHRYLTTNPAAEELSAFDHVIADEYQDLNRLEQDLLDCLATNGSLCIAGDDDQSIYRVRYANPDGILQYLDREDVERYQIGVCGRCPDNILAMANCLISQAPGRHKDDLTPREEAGDDGEVAIVQWPDVEAEADGIASAIAADISSGKREPGDILVLTNWRRVGERIRERLNELDIPTRSFFTEEALRTDEAREALALMRLVIDVDDAPALRVIVGIGEGTGRTEAYQRLLAYCRENSTTPLETLGRLAGDEKFGLTAPALVKRFTAAMARVERLRERELSELVDSLFPEDQPATADLREAAIAALDEAETAEDILRKIVEAVTHDEVPQRPNFVRVMSLHKSKGLTSDAVFVVGAVDGVLPTSPSDAPQEQEAAREEGRRLTYVAVTRAANELVISSALDADVAEAKARGIRCDRVRKAGDRLIARMFASPYIAELGPAAPAPIRGEDWLASR